MSKFDFDKMIDRRGTDSYKWDFVDGALPMWVADMDFEAAPPIMEALQKRLDHGVFGYTGAPKAFGETIAKWWKERHGVDVKPEWALFCVGVVPAAATAIRHLTEPNGKVMVISPVYNAFYRIIEQSGRGLVDFEMDYDGKAYSLDIDALEKCIEKEKPGLMLFCNPQNPVGLIWTAEEIRRIIEICVRHKVYFLSDEIHCDLTRVGKSYNPALQFVGGKNGVSGAEEYVYATVAPTKIFNIAGIKTSAVLVPGEELRKKMGEWLAADQVAGATVFSFEASIAAFSKGGPWLDALREYLDKNFRYIVDTLKKEVPEISLTDADATYLAWLDCRKIFDDDKEFLEFLKKEEKLVLSAGSEYGKAGRGFLRWNYACPMERLEDGMRRFVSAINKWKAR